MVLWVLGPNTRRAYLRVARSLGLSLAHLHALRHAEMAQNDHSHAHTFFPEPQRRACAVGRRHSAPQSRRRRARGPPKLPKDSCRAATLPKPPKSPS